jgi:hypothetical protein
MDIMAIVKQFVKGHAYLYESKSYRNEEGKPRNQKTIIGKIDPNTGTPIYKKEYIERMEFEGTPVELQSETNYPVSAIRKSNVKSYGGFYLYSQIASKSGLLNILRNVFPECWQQILNIACYLVSSGEPVMYCGDWVEQTESFTCNRMSPSAISSLFKTIRVGERNEFFRKWAKHRCEQEYLALDITSVSSYSELISSVEWGYNRDKEKLAQINLCLLMGEKSGLPVFQTVYNGSLKDVSTLKTTLKLASSLSMNKIALVMDKGFCSIKNINEMLYNQQGLRFLISMPFSISFAKERVAQEKSRIDLIENTILLGSDSLRGVTRECAWDGKKNIFAHIFYNARHAFDVKEELYTNIASILEIMNRNPSYKIDDSKFKKYCRVQSPTQNGEGLKIHICYDEVEKSLQNTGWLVILSNHITNASEAISIYRAKDVVEKGFLNMKGSLELGRLRVHSDESMQNKVFVCFIALVLKCFIHRVMLNKGLYYKMTMKKLILNSG